MQKRIIKNGYVATLRTAKKMHSCRICDKIIEPGTRCYSIKWKYGVCVYPHYACVEHLDQYLDGKHDEWVDWLKHSNLTEKDLEIVGC